MKQRFEHFLQTDFGSVVGYILIGLMRLIFIGAFVALYLFLDYKRS